MKKYTLKFNGKTYHYNGNHTEDVIDKFTKRKVFGNPICCNVRLKMCDADTRGEKWAQYEIDNSCAMIEEVV